MGYHGVDPLSVGSMRGHRLLVSPSPVVEEQPSHSLPETQRSNNFIWQK